MQKTYIECRVAVNAIIVYKNQFLLQNVVKRENKIWLPWGKVDLWENFDEALEREILEETWIPRDIYTYKKVAILHDKPNTACKHIYVVKMTEKFEEFNFDKNEISNCFWVNFNDIDQNEDNYRKTWVLQTLNHYLKWYFETDKYLYTLEK